MWTMGFEGEVLESFSGLSWSLSKDHHTMAAPSEKYKYNKHHKQKTTHLN